MEAIFVPLRMCANFFGLVQLDTQFVYQDFIETQSSLLFFLLHDSNKKLKPYHKFLSSTPQVSGFLASIQ